MKHKKLQKKGDDSPSGSGTKDDDDEDEEALGSPMPGGDDGNSRDAPNYSDLSRTSHVGGPHTPEGYRDDGDCEEIDVVSDEDTPRKHHIRYDGH